MLSSATIVIKGLTPRIEDAKSHEPLLSCDALDNTTIGVVNDAKALDGLDTIGGKRFLVAPKNVDLGNSGFVVSTQHDFKRLRYCDRATLEKTTREILQSNPTLVDELDERFQLTQSEKELRADKDTLSRYTQIHILLAEHAKFSYTKMQEYKDEDVAGKMARYQHEDISPIALIGDNNTVVATVRSLKMTDGFAYLSDETIMQSLGDKITDENNRRVFLLAYLMNKACQALPKDQTEFLIIAAGERENIYERVGFIPFPENHPKYAAFVKLGKPEQQLNAAKEELNKSAKEKLAAIKKSQVRVFTLFATAAAGIAAVVATRIFSRRA
jgi:hypothetical protein